jgi:RNA polymerase sigma-70 factor (ECF subfamily)
MIRGIVRRIAPGCDDVEDLVQETFISAFTHLAQLACDDQFAVWLATIARRTALMWHRRRYTQPVLVCLGDSDPDDSTGLRTASALAAREQAARERMRAAVTDALAKLTAAQREAVRLHYFEGYGYRETAALLNTPEATVRGRLDRARAALRKELAFMATTASQGPTLIARDLEALRRAATFAGGDSERPALNTVLFTGSGQIVATDTYRLYVYSSPGLAQSPRLLVRADATRTLRDEFADAEQAELSEENGAWRLRLEGGGCVPLVLVDEQFPAWELCVPEQFGHRATALCGDWRTEVGAIIRAWESDLLEERPGAAMPRAVISLSPAEGQISLTVCGQACSAGRAMREFAVSFPATFRAGDDVLRLAANPRYLSDAVEAMMVDDEAMIEFCANQPRNAFVVRPHSDGGTFVVTMPMLLPAPADA